MPALIVDGAMVILWLACGFLLGLGLLILSARDAAHRFLAAFAQTDRANWIESVLRFVVGMAFVVAAPNLEHPLFARIIGIFLSATATLLVLFPSVHRRFAALAVASVAPFLPLLGIASIALAILLGLYLA